MTMLKLIPIAKLKPNPFRRLEEYPIIRKKVDALKESIATTGFWGTIVARPHEDHYQIAFGHHRMVALHEVDAFEVEIIVRDLSNEQMIKMMARENMEEWGTSAWVELETIRTTIEAYGKDEISLPPVPAKTNTLIILDAARDSLPHLYTKATVAQFLGWTNKRTKRETLQPNFACEVAFKALDTIKAGLIQESDIRGLSRTQLDELIDAQWAIHDANMRVAESNRKQAEEAEKRAKEAQDEAERTRFEKQAKVSKEQEKAARENATTKATRFGKEGAESMRGGEGYRSVKAKAEELKPSVPRDTKNLKADDVVDHIIELLHEIADGKDTLSEQMDLLKTCVNPVDITSDMIRRLQQERESLAWRLDGLFSFLVKPRKARRASANGPKALTS